MVFFPVHRHLKIEMEQEKDKTYPNVRLKSLHVKMLL